MATKKRKATRKRERRRPRPVISAFDRMHDLREAAERVRKEERLLASEPSNKFVN